MTSATICHLADVEGRPGHLGQISSAGGDHSGVGSAVALQCSCASLDKQSCRILQLPTSRHDFCHCVTRVGLGLLQGQH